MKQTNKEIGDKGENDACEFLKNNGYKIIQRNYTCKSGEIDIIALDKKILVFIEVKVRNTRVFGAPELAVTKHKRRQILNVAEIYLFRNKIKNTDCRFDVVAIYYPRNNDSPEINLLVDAFRTDLD